MALSNNHRIYEGNINKEYICWTPELCWTKQHDVWWWAVAIYPMFPPILDGISTLAENHEWDVFQKNTVNCVFSSGEKKDKRISQRPIHRFCGVQRSIIPMVPWFGWESMGIPWWLQREAALRAVLNGRVAVLWFLCDFSVCVFLWRILTLYKTKADKDFSAH